MGRASGGGGPAQRGKAANELTEAGLPLSRGGRGGSELLWCGALGGRRPGGPGAASGLGAQPSGCRGGAGRRSRGARAPRVRGRAPRGEAAPPRGSCPAASLPSSRKKAGAGRGPQNPLATRARSPRGAAASWDALLDVPAEGAGASATCPAGSAAAEWPTGDLPPEGPARGEEMNGFSTEEDSREGPPAAPAAAPGYGQSCCLIEDGERCVRPAGNASFSKRVQKSISQKKLKLDIDKSVRHLYICDFHKNFIQSVRNKRKRKTSDDGGDSPEHDTDIPEVDLFQLQVNTLRRYKRHYKLQTRPGFNKAQLAETVSRHFRNIPVNEKETLAYFIYMVKSNKSRLDQKSESGKQLE
ncbi:hypothetical protein AB1E18_005392 [Capra hircus]